MKILQFDAIIPTHNNSTSCILLFVAAETWQFLTFHTYNYQKLHSRLYNRREIRLEVQHIVREYIVKNLLTADYFLQHTTHIAVLYNSV